MRKKRSRKSSHKVRTHRHIRVKPKGILTTMFMLKRALNVMRSPSSLIPMAVAKFTLNTVKLSSEKTGPISTLRRMFELFGEEWFDLDPEVLMANEYVRGNLDMVMAVRNLLISNDYFNIPIVFEKISLAINGLAVIPDMIQDLNPGVIAYSMFIANVLRDENISATVEDYIVAQLDDDGYSVYLFPFDIDDRELTAEQKEITKAIDNYINSGNIEAKYEEHLNKYYDVLTYIIKKIKEDVPEVFNEN